jgi:hypothetical protein
LKTKSTAAERILADWPTYTRDYKMIPDAKKLCGMETDIAMKEAGLIYLTKKPSLASPR